MKSGQNCNFERVHLHIFAKNKKSKKSATLLTVSFLVMDPRCPRVSYSLSDKMGDGGREPMGEVPGEISGSLKYWGFSMLMGKEPLTLILDEVSSLTSEFSIGSSESTKNELKDSSLGNLESNNEGSVVPVDIGVLDTTASVREVGVGKEDGGGGIDEAAGVEGAAVGVFSSVVAETEMISFKDDLEALRECFFVLRFRLLLLFFDLRTLAIADGVVDISSRMSSADLSASSGSVPKLRLLLTDSLKIMEKLGFLSCKSA